MIALLLATEFELGNRVFEWEDFEGAKLSVLNEGLCLLITGAGLADTALSLSRLEKLKSNYGVSQFINIGIAGCLNEDLCEEAYIPGSFSFNTFSLGESPTKGFVENCYPKIDLYEGPHLATSAVPVWDQRTKQYLSELGADLVDMEAYLFAKWAKESDQDFYFLKFISDRASKESKEKFKTGAFKAIERISEGLCSLEALICESKEVDLGLIKKCFRISS